jgi:hypothetical protein
MKGNSLVRRPWAIPLVAGLVAGVVISAVIASLNRPDTASLDVALAITTLRNEYAWLERRRLGHATPGGTPRALRDERQAGALAPHCTRQYLVRSRGNVVSGYSVSILEVKIAAAFCRWIESQVMFDEFEAYVHSKHWVVLLWK